MEFHSKHSYDFSNYNRNNIKLPRFRADSEEEYYLIRNFFQIIDLISIDYEHLQYSEKLLVASAIYILLGLYLRFFSISQVVSEFTKNINAYSNYYELNSIFNRFTCNFLEIELNHLSQHILYVSFFFNMKFEYESPKFILDNNGKPILVRL
jgi:hypothetical protein